MMSLANLTELSVILIFISTAEAKIIIDSITVNAYNLVIITVLAFNLNLLAFSWRTKTADARKLAELWFCYSMKHAEFIGHLVLQQ